MRIEKRLRNTEEVARALARLAGVRPGDVGYAGRKDRVAVARQWLSVPDLDPERARSFEGEGFRVLEAVRHPHKLRTGQLRANHFELVVRELTPRQVERAAAGLAALVWLAGGPSKDASRPPAKAPSAHPVVQKYADDVEDAVMEIEEALLDLSTQIRRGALGGAMAHVAADFEGGALFREPGGEPRVVG